MQEHRITHHDSKGIHQNLGDLQASYNAACDWKKIPDKVLEICRHWDILDPIMSSRSVTKPVHIQSSLTGDQLRVVQSHLIFLTILLTAWTLVLDQLVQLLLQRRRRTPRSKDQQLAVAVLKQMPKDLKKKITTEELYMKSMVSKQQANLTRARAEASQVKVSYMKELRSHGLSLEEIEKKVAEEFPRLADMENPDDSSSSSSDSNDSSE
ncbi:hypothetical protein PCASD_11673 [Puccinia coronata f. sp. avenae]|uniref:No apical meristem-associated C-terminal domain-containing protein n=1 Tax=Puccinia coronata f. sp. avenae TaxID=200324 RepID=A0A2N5UEG1_9BASI|nr:hypothetical protein PCASD_11673 [Puccinia coronata f. sp. avenae]